MRARPVTRLVLVLAAVAALAGCWSSRTLLLDRHRGADALPAGIYDGELHPMRVEAKGHGWYVISNGEKTRGQAAPDSLVMFMTKLDGGPTPQTYIYAAGTHDCVGHADTCDNWSYGVIVIRGDEYVVGLPDCAKTEAMATAAGAKMTGTAAKVCEFDNADGLRSAMAAFARGGGADKVYRRRK